MVAFYIMSKQALPAIEKKPFVHKDPCEWIPDIPGFVTYIIMCSDQSQMIGYTGSFKARMTDLFNGLGSYEFKKHNKTAAFILHYESYGTDHRAASQSDFYKSNAGQFFLESTIVNSIRPAAPKKKSAAKKKTVTNGKKQPKKK